ncbi:MAG: hypothetical protein K2R98_23995 [Gemmataceae bacterium]|nr:hypothetical protein [Gemmataceae bacterium]
MAPQRPTSVLVIAILQFIFGAIGLVSGVVALGTLATTGGSGMFAPNGPPGSLGADLPKKLEGFMERELPYYKVLNFANAGVDLLLSATMIISGAGLIQVKPWGRTLTIAYAFASLALKVIGFVVALTITLPVMKAFMQTLTPKTQEERMLVTIMDTVATMTPFMLLVFGIYPLVVLYLVTRPHVKAAFSNIGAA